MEEKLLTFRISHVKQETPTAKTYELEPLEENILDFLPGQFLTFLISTEKQEVRRSYSIVSLPGEPLKVTIQKVDNGLISRFILKSWKEGETVVSLPPAGRFNIPAQKAVTRDIFCFAAGSGITPILPQIRNLLVQEPQSIIHLIYSNTNENSALFLSEIEELRNRYPNLNLIYLFSDPLIRLKERGRLSNLLTQDLVNKHLKYQKKDAIFLICGPFTYMRMLDITLISLHIPKEHLHKENFIPQLMLSGYVSHPQYPDRNIQIRINEKLYPLKVKSGQDILSAALQNGLPLPYSCRGGVCGTCAAICKSGKIHMSINEVLTDQDLKNGWILTCTGYPEEENTAIHFP
ncbi:MAG TPA: iron-sulfur cluster-binding domain-containing protein [Daejeonella sp.]|nr:iron-sulfur cluster-binding domain-containing protein [Daejeonella sp.]